MSIIKALKNLKSKTKKNNNKEAHVYKTVLGVVQDTQNVEYRKIEIWAVN